MRYIKDCISLNVEHDYPLLRQVLHAGFVTHEQLFEFMQLGQHESSRSTFNWRARRLTAYGLIARHTVPSLGKTYVYSITPEGALELASTGERFLITPAKSNRSDKELQVVHSLELSNIHLSLLRACVLARWVPEIQIRSRNTMMGFAIAKDYDAIVTVRLEERDATFALEYERSAKSETHYAEIVDKIQSERELDRFLYLASSEQVLRCVSWQFRNSQRHVCFGFLADWYQRLLDTEVFDWKCHQYRPLRAALSSGTYLHPIDAVGVNGLHAVVVAPVLVRVEMFRAGRTCELLITKHEPADSAAGKPLVREPGSVEGVCGLVDAVAKFNPRKRVKLESYARHRIRGSILDGLRGADPVPRDLRGKHKNFQKLNQELEADLGRPVKDEEMAAGLGMTLAQWHHELNEIQSAGIDCGARTLSAGPTFIQTSVEPAFLAGDDSNAFDLCYLREQREILSLSLSQLRERERKIITLYYERGLTMQEIASRMKVDASRVSQLHAAALVQLKAKVHSLLHRGQAEASETGGLSLAAGAGA